MHGKNKLSLDADLEQRIESYAQASKSTPNDVVRKAFEEYEAAHNGGHDPDLRQGCQETLYDRWNRLRFIGCVKGDEQSPTDLSTNLALMEGFGVD
ncbi:MAG: hypothetical protein HY287_03920 [Planctomycetes bacterium]|nr:hypothetical protein [Planctomycetota bacterium]MBI3833460.1 hypothetical protein [Planctomycetota bacterium]